MRTAGHAEYVKLFRFAQQGLYSRIPPSEIVGTTPACFAFVTVKAKREAVNQMADVRWELYPGAWLTTRWLGPGWYLNPTWGLRPIRWMLTDVLCKSTLHSALTGTPLWSLPPRITSPSTSAT